MERENNQGGIVNNFYGSVGSIYNAPVTFNGPVTNQAGERGEEHGKISLEVMGRAIKAVQNMFWGQSSYAVIFCAVRDLYGHDDNGALFEEEVTGLAGRMGFSYACPANTIASAFYNNSYLKLNVGKWEANNVKQRSLLLVKAFKKAVGELTEKK